MFRHFFWHLYSFIDRTASEMTGNGMREGWWHTVKGPRPGIEPGAAVARTHRKHALPNECSMFRHSWNNGSRESDISLLIDRSIILLQAEISVAITFCTTIHGDQRMNPNDTGDKLSFVLLPKCGWHLWFWGKMYRYIGLLIEVRYF